MYRHCSQSLVTIETFHMNTNHGSSRPRTLQGLSRTDYDVMTTSVGSCKAAIMTHVTWWHVVTWWCHEHIMTSGHRQVPACLPRPRLAVWGMWPDLETLRSNQINPRAPPPSRHRVYLWHVSSPLPPCHWLSFNEVLIIINSLWAGSRGITWWPCVIFHCPMSHRFLFTSHQLEISPLSRFQITTVIYYPCPKS